MLQDKSYHRQTKGVGCTMCPFIHLMIRIAHGRPISNLIDVEERQSYPGGAGQPRRSDQRDIEAATEFGARRLDGVHLGVVAQIQQSVDLGGV